MDMLEAAEKSIEIGRHPGRVSEEGGKSGRYRGPRCGGEIGHADCAPSAVAGAFCFGAENRRGRFGGWLRGALVAVRVAGVRTSVFGGR